MSRDFKKPFIPIWLENHGLSLRQYRVLGHLWSRGQGSCFPSLDLIAKVCGIRRATVCNAIRELEEMGLITRRKRKSRGVRFANEYVLNGPPEAPLGNEQVHFEHQLTGTPEAPANRNGWGTGNDLSGNDPSGNETPSTSGEAPPSLNSAFREMVNAIWNSTPPKGRERSSKKELEAALKKIPVRGHPKPAELLSALDAWKLSHSWLKDGGQYVPGIHRWINDRKWEYLPDPATSGAAASINNGRRPSTIEDE